MRRRNGMKFDSFKAAKRISFDIETRDEDLKSKGPGVRRNGYIIGVALGTDDRQEYYPIRHAPGGNLDQEKVLAFLREELGRENQIKFGTNLLYDLDFLAEAGVPVRGFWYDVQNAEPLIDENRGGFYNLGALAHRHLGEKKEEEGLIKICAENGWKGEPQRHLWKMRPHEVEDYAKADVVLPLKIFDRQRPILERDGLWDLFLMETRLMPMLLHMRRTGVRVDEERLERLTQECRERLSRSTTELKKEAGSNVDVWAASSLERLFDQRKIKYPRTPKTDRGSFTKEFLASCDDPVARSVLDCRTLDKFIGTFLEGSIKNQIIRRNGDSRIHCQFNQLRSDEFGAVTGRFSASNPNLQFIPARDAELGPKCRAVFIPEKGCRWGKFDYNQVEFRIFACYARGPKSEEFREQYKQAPRTDYHEWCAGESHRTRREAKTINFGLIYGMGPPKLAKALGMTEDEVRRFLAVYEEKLPFIRATIKAASDKAQRIGFVRTILGRRRRFESWEPVDNDLREKLGSMRDSSALLNAVQREITERCDQGKSAPKTGIRRTGTFKALNAVIQGSAADLMKQAMVNLWERKVCDRVPVHLTVHDELGVSLLKGSEEPFSEEIVHIMENAIRFKEVPIIVDHDATDNWGGLEENDP
jgi:DNA polymerase I-like protein with 3'-5' exonuclease and polymerase domains